MYNSEGGSSDCLFECVVNKLMILVSSDSGMREGVISPWAASTRFEVRDCKSDTRCCI